MMDKLKAYFEAAQKGAALFESLEKAKHDLESLGLNQDVLTKVDRTYNEIAEAFAHTQQALLLKVVENTR
jgi:hypothetical protein